MGKIKKTILSLQAAILIVLPLFATAQVGGVQNASISITSIGVAIANVVWIIFTVIAVICFVIAGVLFLTAFGDATKLTAARSAFIWGIVGVVVAIIAFSIISIVRGALGA